MLNLGNMCEQLKSKMHLWKNSEQMLSGEMKEDVFSIATAKMILELGSQVQKDLYVRTMFAGEWTGTIYANAVNYAKSRVQSPTRLAPDSGLIKIDICLKKMV